MAIVSRVMMAFKVSLDCLRSRSLVMGKVGSSSCGMRSGRRIVESFELTVRVEPRENKQAQTLAVSRSYRHQCGGNMLVLERV